MPPDAKRFLEWADFEKAGSSYGSRCGSAPTGFAVNAMTKLLLNIVQAVSTNTCLSWPASAMLQDAQARKPDVRGQPQETFAENTAEIRFWFWPLVRGL